MKRFRPSESGPPQPQRLVASLDGPSKTITVEPLQMPGSSPRPLVVPAPAHEPAREPAREPERPREPAR